MSEITDNIYNQPVPEFTVTKFTEFIVPLWKENGKELIDPLIKKDIKTKLDKVFGQKNWKWYDSNKLSNRGGECHCATNTEKEPELTKKY